MTVRFMRYIIILLLFLFPFVAGNSQVSVNVDSSYSYPELNRMLKEARNNLNDLKTLADIYFKLAESEEIRFKYDRSFEYYTNSLAYYQKLKDTVQIYKVQEAIADRYKSAQLYDESIDLYQDILDYYVSQKNFAKMAQIYSNIANVHRDRGNIDKEQEFINRAIAANKNVNDTLLTIEFIMDKVKNYERLNEIDSALYTAFIAWKLSDKIKNNNKKSLSLASIGYLNKLKANYNRAIRYLEESEKLMGKEPYNVERRAVYQNLADAYYKINDYKKAYRYNQKYTELNDSILEKDRIEALSNNAIKHDADMKRLENEMLANENELKEQEILNQKRALYIMAIGLTLLLVLIYYLVRFYTQKIKTEKIINHQKEEINNQKIRELEDNIKISSMQSMIEGQELERERIAQDLHDSLGGLLSTIKLQFDSIGSQNGNYHGNKEYHKANNLLDTAVKEVRSISHNLQPGSLSNLGLVAAIKDLINRFESDAGPEIDFQHYGIPDKMDNMTSLSIYRIVQELFHNALKHSNANEILLQINYDEEEIVIQFEDDGIGFDIENLQRKGMGLENINSRVNYLKGSVSIDSNPGDGTSYLIHLKHSKN